MTFTEKACFQRGLELIRDKLVDEGPDEAMEFIEQFCPSAADKALKLYTGLREYANKMKKWSGEFMIGLPETITEPMEKVRLFIFLKKLCRVAR